MHGLFSFVATLPGVFPHFFGSVHQAVLTACAGVGSTPANSVYDPTQCVQTNLVGPFLNLLKFVGVPIGAGLFLIHKITGDGRESMKGAAIETVILAAVSLAVLTVIGIMTGN